MYSTFYVTVFYLFLWDIIKVPYISNFIVTCVPEDVIESQLGFSGRMKGRMNNMVTNYRNKYHSQYLLCKSSRPSHAFN